MLASWELVNVNKWEKTGKSKRRTAGAVQISEVKNISCAALSTAGSAEGYLALFEERSGHGGGGESEDGGEKHGDGLKLVVWFGLGKSEVLSEGW